MKQRFSELFKLVGIFMGKHIFLNFPTRNSELKNIFVLVNYTQDNVSDTLAVL